MPENAYERENAHLAYDVELRPGEATMAPPRCPQCDRVMSWREYSEQGACNDCNGGAYWPNH